MMFALRGTFLSLTFFVLLYCALSILVVLTWRLAKLSRAPERSLADFLFALRVLPMALSVVLTLAFVVPSFQLLEPHSIEEGMGTIPPALGFFALLLIACGCLRVIIAQSKTSRAVARWLQHATPLTVEWNASVVALRASGDAPPIILAGIRNPRVLVSEFTVRLLSQDELRIALRHESAHIHSRDNLKKLLFRFCPFPGMNKLESTWSQVTEVAADIDAVSKIDDAVNLAAALVKLSRLVPAAVPAICTVGFVSGSIRERVARLLAWNGVPQARPTRFRRRAIPALLISLLGVFFVYGPALRLTHDLTEWLVR